MRLGVQGLGFCEVHEFRFCWTQDEDCGFGAERVEPGTSELWVEVARKSRVGPVRFRHSHMTSNALSAAGAIGVLVLMQKPQTERLSFVWLP